MKKKPKTQTKQGSKPVSCNKEKPDKKENGNVI
jgi:hypothetical protein